jgi:two-component system KDP operon response regulator KdpE
MMSKRKTILIVDDDPELLRGLAIRLRAEGYQVLAAANAGAVVTAAVGGQPDLVLLDLGLPDGDGMAVLSRLQAIVDTASIPVVVLSARDLSWAPRAFASGAIAFLQKPVDDDELFAAIDMALESAGTNVPG